MKSFPPLRDAYSKLHPGNNSCMGSVGEELGVPVGLAVSVGVLVAESVGDNARVSQRLQLGIQSK